MSDTLVKVETVSKKFCRRLRRSLWYGLNDLGFELIGRHNSHNELRKQEFWAVKDVSFESKRGDTLGLIGANGAGKTTLLRMLNGLIKPDSGRIEIKGRMQALIALGAGFNPILTGRENLYINASVLGIPKSEVARRFDEIVDFSGIEEFIDTPVQSYSSGMAVRLGFAVAAHMEPDILLVDEVLAVGDEGFQSKCLNKIGELKKNGTAIILVSHNMHTISTHSTNVMLLNKGNHTFFKSVPEGVKEYRKLFFNENDSEIQKYCPGNDKINFYDISASKKEFQPGDSLSIYMKYKSLVDYREVEVDTTLYCDNQPLQYFQATNKAYRIEIDLPMGEHEFSVRIENIPVNSKTVRIHIAIWAKNRTELLSWVMIPVEFKGIDHSTGANFFNVCYKLK
jgi:ABC-type polysaccharide/polyol phosphate transport system ATPase subunit